MSEYIVKGAEPNETVLHRITPNGYEGWSWLPVLEEIVRCRDCIHCEEAINGKALCERFSMEGSGGTLYPTVEWDGFCKWGERMNA